jgi:hypothetical protein
MGLPQVRPKCYYCRRAKPCPWIECSRCTNRVVVPKYYRRSTPTYLCPACDNPETKVSTVVETDTTPNVVIKENGLGWLGLTVNDDIFQGKSAYKLMQAHGTTVFDHDPTPKETKLMLQGKLVQNPEDARMQVEEWVGTGSIELGSCTLCFEEMAKNKLLAACGRKGCSHKADTGCLQEWASCFAHCHSEIAGGLIVVCIGQYGKSEPGKLLSIMQLACPFCRRKPAPQTLARYNAAAMALGGLRAALEDRAWFYAWCLECGFAKQAVERVCAEGGLPDIRQFRCADCIRIAEIQAAQNRQERGRAAISSQSTIRIMECPTCNVSVEKVGTCVLSRISLISGLD